MGNGNKNDQFVFPLTSLQIGDLQSYLSHLSLFLAPESKRFYVLVDNRPWLDDLVSRPAHLWQLMVTKSRLSPFASTRVRKKRIEDVKIYGVKDGSSSNLKKFKKWFSLIDAATFSRKRALLLPVKKLRTSLALGSKLERPLYGFIVFEVAWDDVRGINYLNELQTDTSLAIEAKFMRRWEFDSIAQAARCISSWFPGEHYEQFLLKDYLDSAVEEVFYDAQEEFPCSSLIPDDENSCNLSSFAAYVVPSTENEPSTPHTPPPPDGPYKRRKVMKSNTCGVEVDIYPEETQGGKVGSPICSLASYANDCEEVSDATQYKDVLLLLRFSDRDLPFKLREVIVSDLRLLTLLEYGLPSWVIFLQSYPGFCHLYRPWMCPLARALYVLISIVTVLIGFYDLYKNVPVLKATASRLFGPLFDWIETWEMVSRIKYLGTMLFLHNFQKAVEWFLMITHTSRSFLSVLAQPLAGPFFELLELILPIWNMFIQVSGNFCSVIWIMISSFFSLLEDLVEIVVLPIWFIISFIWSIVTSIMYPIFWILWEILYAPIRLVLGFSSIIAFIITSIYELVGDMWLFVSTVFKFAPDEKTLTYEASVWRSLWNILFSQVFRAVRSILNGFVAFFVACNRHRLSTYNYVKEFIKRFSHRAERLRPPHSSHRGQMHVPRNLLEDMEETRHQRKPKKHMWSTSLTRS